MGKKFVDLANLKSNLENFFSEIISPTFATKEGVSEQLGNHTVKSDVPENAVFTDTVYDDTEVQKRISDNGYGELAGGKNLANPKNFVKNKVVSFDTGYIVDNPNYFVSGYIEVKPNTTYVRQGASDGSENYSYDENKKPISIIGTKFTTSSNTKYVCLSGLKGKENIMMLEEGSTATEYEPYFPSNKMLAEEKADKSETTVNLLNPTLGTTTVNGITCTNNGDGTYTLNGTATANFSEYIITSFGLSQNESYKLLGTPVGGSVQTYSITLLSEDYSDYVDDIGEGVIITPKKSSYLARLNILKGTTVNNLVFKPMLTTNLNATYDDFVPYTGDTGRLNGDVAKLKNDLDKLSSLPIGSIIQIDENKDDIETTKQKYGWQYLGKSNIQYESGSATLLVTNVYRKND